MDYEVKDVINEMTSTFSQFKEANDRRLNEIENKGHADPLSEDKVNRLNKALSQSEDAVKKTQSRLDKLETALNRSGSPISVCDEIKEADIFGQERKAGYGRALDTQEYTSYKSALHNYIRRNNAGSDIEEIKALSAGSDPDGGYWVTPDISGRITELLQDTSPIRQIANVVTISTDRLEGVSHVGEAGAGWVGETDARTETTSPTLEQYSIPVH